MRSPYANGRFCLSPGFLDAISNASLFKQDRLTAYDVTADLENEVVGCPAGRPVDILQLHDGSILVSDDTGSAVYRITFDGSAA